MTRLAAVTSWLTSTFWFRPALMTVGAAALALVLVAVDRAVIPADTPGWWWLYTGGAEGARSLLSTVAASMITVVGVTFSITIVALQLASSQFGPRLLHNFVRDPGNQFVLGMFMAAFMYCLLVLRTVRGEDGEVFIPQLAVTMAVLLAAAGVAVLIYFIHHVATTIQADNIVEAVGRELEATIGRLCPEAGNGVDADSVSPPGLPAGFETEAETLGAPRTGYIQLIDVDALLAIATERDVVLLVRRRPGQFVAEGESLVCVWPPGRATPAVAATLRGAVLVGAHRTSAQDLEFGIFQLVEIAVRALSPGINDPHTALGCVDRLGAALARLARRAPPPAWRCDHEGRLRVVAEQVTIGGIVDAAFDEIRQHARSNVAVTIRLLETIARLGSQIGPGALSTALLRQMTMIERGSREFLPDPSDRADVEARYRRALDALGARIPRKTIEVR